MKKIDYQNFESLSWIVRAKKRKNNQENSPLQQNWVSVI